MAPATERRILGLIGLGIRARNVVVGVEQVRVAARKGRVVLAIVAPDASRHSQQKVLPLLAALKVRTVQGPGAVALGGVAGRETTAAVGIIDRALASGVLKVLDEQREPQPGEAVDRRHAGGRAATRVARRIG